MNWSSAHQPGRTTHLPVQDAAEIQRLALPLQRQVALALGVGLKVPPGLHPHGHGGGLCMCVCVCVVRVQTLSSQGTPTNHPPINPQAEAETETCSTYISTHLGRLLRRAPPDLLGEVAVGVVEVGVGVLGGGVVGDWEVAVVVGGLV